MTGAEGRGGSAEGAHAEAGDTLQAAREALDQFAWDEARDLLLRVTAEQESAEAFELLTRAYRWMRDEPATIDAGERAFLLYSRGNDTVAAARVAMWLAVDILELRGHDAVANGWLARSHRLLEAVPSAPEHGLLEGVEAYLALMARNDAVEAIERADRGLAIAREVGSLEGEMACLAIKGLALVTSGSVPQGMALLDEACTAALHEGIGDPTLRSTILCALMDACDRVRDFNRASQWCTRIREAAERWQLPQVTTVCRPHYAVVLTWRGLWDEAASELTAAIDEYREYRPLLATEGLARLAELRLRQGKLDEASALFSRVEHDGIAQPGRAEFALTNGEPRQAVTIAERRLRSLPPSDSVERAPVLDILARAAIDAGDTARAAEAVAELRAIARETGTVPLRAMASRAEGLLALAGGDSEGAQKSLEDAVDGFARDEAPYETARSRVMLGRALDRNGREADAAAEWSRALETFRGLGAGLDAARVNDLLENPSAGARRHESLPLGLSAREVEIVRLVAGGLSNQDIAETLVLSVRTVERHISNVYAKLGIAGQSARAVVTARAFELGLLTPK